MSPSAGGSVRRRWWQRPGLRLAAWWSAVVLTGLNAFVVGYGSVWFQLFGETPDRGDYLVSAGGYLTGAVVLAAGATVARRAGGGTAAALTAALGGVLCALAGIFSLASALDEPAEDRPSAGVADGVGGVLFLPWSWLLLGWAARAALGRARRPG